MVLLARLMVLGAAAVLCAPSARAQEVIHLPRSDTTLLFGLGLVAGPPGAGAALQVALDHIMTGNVHLELVGSYLDRGLRAEAWTAYAGARLDLADKGERAIPYFAAGAGIYRASYQRMDAGIWDEDGVGCVGPANDEACYASMPSFYTQRMHVPRYGSSWPNRRQFMDPMVVVGVGVRWEVTPQLFVIPDLRALLVTGDGDTTALGTFTVSVGYRF